MKKHVHIDIVDRRSPSAPPMPPGPGTGLDSLLAIAQQGALMSNLAFANQVHNTDLAGKAQAARQQGMDRLRLSLLAQAVGRVQALRPPEARASVAALTDDAAAHTLADLRSAAATDPQPAP